MKKKLHAILNVDNSNSPLSKIYNLLNIMFSIVSIVPLLFHQQTETLWTIEVVAVIFFILDYFLRWLTADYELSESNKVKAYFIYPFTFYAIIDSLAILPFLTIINQSLRLFRLFRLSRSLRIFRVFRIFRHSKSLDLLIRTIKKIKDPLIIVGILTVTYIFISSLIVFNIEPDTYPTFLEALLWATSSLTTATYGDIYPKSTLGQIISIISYLVGVGVVALPSSILTAGYINEVKNAKEIEIKDELEE